MILFPLLAAAYTFTASATGVDKGTSIEFFFAAKASDRDYESMFLLDQDVDSFCRGLESAGLRRGKPVDSTTLRLWPVGCQVKISPDMSEFITTKMPEGLPLASVVYTGGTRNASGVPVATTNMPMSVFSLYSLEQSPFVFNGLYDQGSVYGCHVANKQLEKGKKFTFTVTWDESTYPQSLRLVMKPGKGAELIQTLKEASVNNELDVLVDFSPELTVNEAKSFSEALSVIDSPRVKINGFVPGHLYFRAFLPLVKWTDRKERLTQPFELTVGDENRLVYLEEDWTVKGLDPKIIPHDIPISQASQYLRTDTCFIYVSATTRLQKVYEAMEQLKAPQIRNWYIFVSPGD